jgi:insertion element IS1 protein InsB
MEVKCPYCESDQIVKNGITRHKKQNYKFKKCNRQFVINPKNQPIPKSTIEAAS